MTKQRSDSTHPDVATTPEEVRRSIEEICQGYERAFRRIATNWADLKRLIEEVGKSDFSESDSSYLYDAFQLVMKRMTGMEL